MVKGISRQVIVVHSPDKQMFEQAIFILKEGQHGVSDEVLLNEAKRLINAPSGKHSRKLWLYGPTWAFAGAMAMGLVWLTCSLL